MNTDILQMATCCLGDNVSQNPWIIVNHPMKQGRKKGKTCFIIVFPASDSTHSLSMLYFIFIFLMNQWSRWSRENDIHPYYKKNENTFFSYCGHQLHFWWFKWFTVFFIPLLESNMHEHRNECLYTIKPKPLSRGSPKHLLHVMHHEMIHERGPYHFSVKIDCFLPTPWCTYHPPPSICPSLCPSTTRCHLSREGCVLRCLPSINIVKQYVKDCQETVFTTITRPQLHAALSIIHVTLEKVERRSNWEDHASLKNVSTASWTDGHSSGVRMTPEENQTSQLYFLTNMCWARRSYVHPVRPSIFPLNVWCLWLCHTPPASGRTCTFQQQAQVATPHSL